MPTIPDLFAQCSIPYASASSSRVAFVTFGIDNQGAFATPQEIAEAVWTPWEDNMIPRTDSNVVVGPVHVQQGTGSGINSGDGTSIASGTSAANSPPPNVALLVQKQTGLGGHANRGRMYLPWSCDESGLDEAGRVEPTVVSATTDAFNALLADLDTAGVPMCILHTGAGVPARVLSGACEGLVATQRRRLGRG